MKFEKLTRANMRALPEGGEIIESGIRYKKLPKGDGRFTIDLMVNRKRIHRVIGTESAGVTREKCEETIQKLKTEAREKRLRLPKGRKVALLFETAASEYLERIKITGGSDYKDKKQRMEDHIIPFYKGKPLEELTDWDIDRYKSQRQKQKVQNADRLTSNASINRELSVLSHFLRKAVRWGWIDKVPCLITKLEETGRRDLVLSPEQCEAFLKACKKNEGLFTFVYIALKTSMRAGEIYSIRIENINLDNNSIYLPNAKAGSRHQPIPAECAEYLRSKIQGDSGWLFPSAKSKTGHKVNFNKAFRLAAEEAKLPKEVARHTLRHTTLSLLCMAGVDLATLQEISGHKTQKVLRQNYIHLNNNHVQNAFAKLRRNSAGVNSIKKGTSP